MVPTSTRSCPVCRETGRRIVRVVDGWELAACERCSFLYAPVIRTETATEVELPEDYQPIWRARHRQIHRLLETLLPPGDLVVDVGAGFGELGLVARERDRFRYVGFEPSQSVAASAQRRGVDLRAELFTAQSLAEPVGAIVLDNVIEHLAGPVELLRESVEALRPGGVLVVIVPNRHDVRQLIPRWRDQNHWIPPEHINYFTPASLGRILGELGLAVHPFAFKALSTKDWRYWPRAALELIGVYPFGINVYGIRT